MCAEKAADGPFEPTWESLTRYTVPAWYVDGKFGIFIHWGPYSVPAFGNEWYPRNMYKIGTPEHAHHIATHGPHTEFGYKDFIPQFTAEQFDPAEWAQLFKDAGARFVVPVAEHHDGFAMYDTALSEWNAVAMGPKRDVIGELAAAIRAQDLVFGLSSHRYEHWWFFEGGRQFDSDVQDERFAELYGPAEDPYQRTKPWFNEDWLARTKELIDKYEPQLIWFDWRIEDRSLEPYLRELAAYYYNALHAKGDWDANGPAINYKFDAFPDGAAVFDVERGQLAGIRPTFWQTDTSVSKTSWSYVVDQDYKTAGSIVGDLVDIVSKNGALLLNIGPKPDGTIPEPEQEMLREIGSWLAVNGEAIYGSRPWTIFGEGPTEVAEGEFTDTSRAPFTAEDIRFTTNGSTLYAVLLAWPGRSATVTSLGTAGPIAEGDITSVTLLGRSEALSWRQDAAGLHVELPSTPPCDHAYTLKIARD